MKDLLSTHRLSVLVAAAMKRDGELILEYVRQRSQPAFAQLVTRHVDAVYASARRQTRDAELAEDVTQAVFLMLSQRAATLRPDVLLAGWLMTAAWYACKNVMRKERRRRIHEAQAATMMRETVETAQPPEADAEPILDRALQSLKEADRAAVVMHYLQGCDFREVAAALQTTAEAARKRTERAVAKLRLRFAQTGVEMMPAAVVACLGEAARVKAPAG